MVQRRPRRNSHWKTGRLRCDSPGCGSSEMRSVTDNVDAEAIAEYERMIAEAEEKANADNAK